LGLEIPLFEMEHPRYWLLRSIKRRFINKELYRWGWV
jgi:hypothetical protein